MRKNEGSRSTPYLFKCMACGKPDPAYRDRRRKFCNQCGYARLVRSSNRWQKETPKAQAHKAVRRITATAVRAGFLQHPSTMMCVDCGAFAHCYDHRDYNKPLEVEPVCLSCNVRRGPGIAYSGVLFRAPEVEIEGVA